MSEDVLPDPDTTFGARVRERLANDRTIWLTTVGKDGTPQPNPVWFLHDDGEIIIYSIASANRLVHYRTRPRVSLNLDSNDGGDVVVLTGDARDAPDEVPCDQSQAYLAKYADQMVEISGSTAKFAATYSQPTRITITKVRGF